MPTLNGFRLPWFNFRISPEEINLIEMTSG